MLCHRFADEIHVVRIIFDHGEAMAPRDFHDRIHLASDSGIVNGQDRLCAPRDQTVQEFFVPVQCVRPDVYEDRTGTSQELLSPLNMSWLDTGILVYPRLPTMRPAVTSNTPRTFGTVTVSWKKTALRISISTKARLANGYA